MPLCNLYELQYTVTKTTAKDTVGESLRKDCMVLANSIKEAEERFNKEFVNKRGTSYELTSISLYEKTVLK